MADDALVVVAGTRPAQRARHLFDRCDLFRPFRATKQDGNLRLDARLERNEVVWHAIAATRLLEQLQQCLGRVVRYRRICRSLLRGFLRGQRQRV